MEEANLVDREINLLADKMYSMTDRIKPLYRGNLTVAAGADNVVMSKIRVPEEWIFGKIGENWKGIFFKRCIKINESPVGMYYIVCALLTNMYTMLAGSIAHRYFSQKGLVDLVIENDLLE